MTKFLVAVFALALALGAMIGLGYVAHDGGKTPYLGESYYSGI